MAGPTDVPVRRAAVAGMFYPESADDCRAMARQYLDAAAREAEAAGDFGVAWRGGIVPHAGWICSGAVAARTIAALSRARKTPVDVVVIFGAVHTSLPIHQAALDSFASWQLPGESLHVAGELRGRIHHEASNWFVVDDRFHLREHAVEVELPFVQQAWPQAAILPVEVPLVDDAIDIGKLAAHKIIDAGLDALFLASSDLTHYGPMYGFAPAGVGRHGLAWATENDRRLLELVERFEPERVVREVSEHYNACGGGAIAAMLAASREFGATRAKVLRQTNSYQTLASVAPQPPDNAVGYAAVVVG